jgi:hypothetical protein
MITIDAPIADGPTRLYLVHASGVLVGELIYSDVEGEHDVGALLPGWTTHVYAASDGRLVPDLTRVFVSGLGSRRSAVRAALAQLDANDRWAARTFAHVVRRTEHTERLLRELSAPYWKVPLAALYLYAGQYMPKAAERGVTFGFCDAHGQIRHAADATHVGWSVAP